jgi:moderate conductance mechanosensitive channel
MKSYFIAFKDNLILNFSSILDIHHFFSYFYNKVEKLLLNYQEVYGTFAVFALIFLCFLLVFKLIKNLIKFVIISSIFLLIAYFFLNYFQIKDYSNYLLIVFLYFISLAICKEMLNYLKNKTPPSVLVVFRFTVFFTINWIFLASLINLDIDKEILIYKGFVKFVLFGLFIIWSISFLIIRQGLLSLIENRKSAVVKRALKIFYKSSSLLIFLILLTWFSDDLLFEKVEKFVISIFIFWGFYFADIFFKNWYLNKIRNKTKEFFKFYKLISFVIKVSIDPIIFILVCQVWEVNIVDLVTKWIGNGKITSFLLVSLSYILFRTALIFSNIIIDNARFLQSKSTLEDHTKRFETLKNIVTLLFKTLTWLIFIICIILSCGLNISPIFSNFWLLTAGVSLSLQSILKDFSVGVIILFEDTFRIGEVVEVAGVLGTVEEITLRVLKLRNPAGSLISIPFSNVELVANRSRSYILTPISFMVDVKHDPDYIISLMKEAGSMLKTSSALSNKVLDNIEVFGVSKISSNGMLFEGRIKTYPMHPKIVQSAYYSLTKSVFDKNHIEFTEDIQGFFKSK